MKVFSNWKALCTYYSYNTNNSNIVTICQALVNVQNGAKCFAYIINPCNNTKRDYSSFAGKKTETWHSIVR